MSARSTSTSPTSRRRLWWGLGALLLLLLALGLLALPFRTVPGDAQAAKNELLAARDAVSAGDSAAAKLHVDRARTHVDSLQAAVQGVGGDVWRWVPLAGGPVSDVRHLGDALDDLTDVAATGVGTMGVLDDSERPLMKDMDVDLEVLDEVVDDVRVISAKVDTAQASLEQVDDSRLLGGTMLSEARDEALDVVEPVGRALEGAEPLLDELPLILGGEGRKRYLVAMLNESEMRYSGGAPLTFATLTADAGKIGMWGPIDGTDPSISQRMSWRRVKGNVFHRNDAAVSGATFAPSWSVSGEEFARAWRKAKRQRLDGVVVVDMQALSGLLTVTGPVEAPGYGTLSGDDLVRSVIGSYDEFDGDQYERKELNRALVPIFADQIFSSAQMLPKLQSLGESAAGRHFAVWMREPEWQQIMVEAGLDGDLSDTEHDYLGVFNQNVNGAKSDYWLKRATSSEVEVAEDGSATVRTTITLHNDSPAWPFPEPDPQASSWVTRWNSMALATFLPMGAEITSLTKDGETVESPWTGAFYERPWVRTDVTLEPGARARIVLEYTVPSAAEVGADGALEYQLTMDPHTLVNPEGRAVTVTFPEGTTVTDVPSGWTKEGGTARLELADLTKTVDFTVTAKP